MSSIKWTIVALTVAVLAPQIQAEDNHTLISPRIRSVLYGRMDGEPLRKRIIKKSNYSSCDDQGCASAPLAPTPTILKKSTHTVMPESAVGVPSVLGSSGCADSGTTLCRVPSPLPKSCLTTPSTLSCADHSAKFGCCDSGGDIGLKSVCDRTHWTIGLAGGLDFPVEGTFHTAQSASVDTALLGLGAGTVPFEIGEAEYKDIFPNFQRYGLEARRQVTDHVGLVLGAGYTKGDAQSRQIGTAGGNALFAQFDDYEDVHLYSGFRYVVNPQNRIRFVLGTNAGVRFVNDMNATLSSPGLGLGPTNVNFYDDTTVFSFGTVFGLEVDVVQNLVMTIETGSNFQTQLDRDDSSLAPLGLGNLNDGSGVYSVPLRFGLTYRW